MNNEVDGAHAVAQVGEAPRYKPIPDGMSDFSLT
jgi:hypothetical protein